MSTDPVRAAARARRARAVRARLAGWARLTPPEWVSWPLLTAGEQTRLSWACALESLDQLPAQFREAFLALFPRVAARLPYTLLIPSREGFFQRLNPRLLALEGDAICILVTSGEGVEATRYRTAGITYLELGTILLKSWLTLRGPADGGLHVTSRLEYNTVNDRLFQPFVEQIRCAPAAQAQLSLEGERAKFDYLGPLNYKFMNYARRSLLPGECVHDCLLQPEVRRTVLRVLGKTLECVLIPAHLAILTDRELILIEDGEDPPLDVHGTRYGGIWRFVRLDRITSAETAPGPDGRLGCSLGLDDGDRLALEFAAENGPNVDRFLAALRDLVPTVAADREPA